MFRYKLCVIDGPVTGQQDNLRVDNGPVSLKDGWMSNAQWTVDCWRVLGADHSSAVALSLTPASL